MNLVQMLSQASIVALISMLVSVLPVVAGAAYLIRPTEERLALMRPVSLAGLFAALTGCVLGLINVLQYVWTQEAGFNVRILAIGTAESLVTLFLAFGSLTVAWLCVAIGYSRASTPE